MLPWAKQGIYKPKAMLSFVVILLEPCSVTEALASQIGMPLCNVNMMHWCEYDALISNGTCDLVPKPKDAKIIGHKWMFRTKPQADRSLE